MKKYFLVLFLIYFNNFLFAEGETYADADKSEIISIIGFSSYSTPIYHHDRNTFISASIGNLFNPESYYYFRDILMEENSNAELLYSLDSRRNSSLAMSVLSCIPSYFLLLSLPASMGLEADLKYRYGTAVANYNGGFLYYKSRTLTAPDNKISAGIRKATGDFFYFYKTSFYTDFHYEDSNELYCALRSNKNSEYWFDKYIEQEKIVSSTGFLSALCYTSGFSLTLASFLADYSSGDSYGYGSGYNEGTNYPMLISGICTMITGAIFSIPAFIADEKKSALLFKSVAEYDAGAVPYYFSN